MIKSGADVNAKDHNFKTSLHHAAKRNFFEIIKILVQHGANIYEQNIYGLTPLIYAV